MICGSPNHWWRECPDRHSAKGKSKTKSKALNFMYGIEHYSLGITHEGYAQVYELVPKANVVLDLGATESAGCADAVTELVDKLEKYAPEAEVTFDLEDRAWFRFADGEWLQALSCVRITTRFGIFNIYVLDVEKTPILFSVNALRTLGAVICVQSAVMAFKKFPNEPPLQLGRLPSGHLTMDILDLCVSRPSVNSE